MNTYAQLTYFFQSLLYGSIAIPSRKVKAGEVPYCARQTTDIVWNIPNILLQISNIVRNTSNTFRKVPNIFWYCCNSLWNTNQEAIVDVVHSCSNTCENL